MMCTKDIHGLHFTIENVYILVKQKCSFLRMGTHKIEVIVSNYALFITKTSLAWKTVENHLTYISISIEKLSAL